MDKKNRKWVSFILVATGIFMSTLDSSIVHIALPVIMENLNAPFKTVQWMVVIYLLTISSTLLAFGRLSDIKGRRWVYCYGFVWFTLGSLLCGTAGQASYLILSRAFQGIGAAMIMACSPALVVDAFPLKERGKALGLVGNRCGHGPDGWSGVWRADSPAFFLADDFFPECCYRCGSRGCRLENP
ncbi:MFS transporter [Desulfosarcina sp.]|uniref:MFS transporter n=1 Tax=Desulfosarcina sp. TaxID=2027861 RepID=UPI0029AFFED8|nr:MFS transporter [Desulfosarcina sp.]MDX2452864.1 MFS transporter [Desulfosarcina sp.]MDX2490608.1 MFS transporter [Desulfosarcina sp.]